MCLSLSAWLWTISCRRSPARTAVARAPRGAHLSSAAPGLSLTDDHHLAARSAGPRVTRGGDLSTLDRTQERPESFPYWARCVGRSIIHQHNLVLITGSGRTNGAKRSRQFRFFIIGRHNERNDNPGGRRLGCFVRGRWIHFLLN